MDTPKGMFLDCTTGEVVERDLTPEEIAELPENQLPTSEPTE